MKTLIFSDLDGTLLDHFTYSHEAAKDAISGCIQLHIPIIINTSKSRVEVLEIQRMLCIDAPFIVENGAAIYFSHNHLLSVPLANRQSAGIVERNGLWCKIFAAPRQRWLDLIDKLKPRWRQSFLHFNELSSQHIAEYTGLTQRQAAQAKQRDFGEPIYWRDSPEAREAFISECIEHGASPIMGGRFLHLCGPTDKGQAMQWLTQFYCENDAYIFHQNNHDKITQAGKTEHYRTIALGDGKNDNAMLEVADIAVQIKSPTHDYPHITPQGLLIQTLGEGPVGWQQAISQILDLPTGSN